MRMFSTDSNPVLAVACPRSDAELEDLRRYADAFNLDIAMVRDLSQSPPSAALCDCDGALTAAIDAIKAGDAEIVLVHDEPNAGNFRRLAALEADVRIAGGELHTRLGPMSCFDGALSKHVRAGLLEMRRLRLEERVLKLGRQAWFDRMRSLDCGATYGYAFAVSPTSLTEQKLALAKRGCEHVFADRANVENLKSRPELRRLAHIAAAGDTIRVVDADCFGRGALALPAFIDALDDKAVTVVDQDESVIWPFPKEVLSKLHAIARPSHRLSA